MALVTKITTHTADAKARVISQWRDKPKITGTLGAITDQIQAIEDAAYDVYTFTDIDNAEGWWLDQLGALVGKTRQGWDDDTYRLQIWGQIGINCGNGTGPDVISIFTFLTGADHVVMTPYYPASIFLQCSSILTSLSGLAILQIMQKVVGAGVKVIGIGHYEPPTEDSDVFAIEGDTEGKGFGDLDYADEGGKLSELIAY